MGISIRLDAESYFVGQILPFSGSLCNLIFPLRQLNFVCVLVVTSLRPICVLAVAKYVQTG